MLLLSRFLCYQWSSWLVNADFLDRIYRVKHSFFFGLKHCFSHTAVSRFMTKHSLNSSLYQTRQRVMKASSVC
uniref:Putative secreted peptide n=1 Tax=Anopheles braziliensis TaxID=58242 RepID=A0A2M3ZVD4_9DIPT